MIRWISAGGSCPFSASMAAAPRVVSITASAFAYGPVTKGCAAFAPCWSLSKTSTSSTVHLAKVDSQREPRHLPWKKRGQLAKGGKNGAERCVPVSSFFERRRPSVLSYAQHLESFPNGLPTFLDLRKPEARRSLARRAVNDLVP